VVLQAMAMASVDVATLAHTIEQEAIAEARLIARTRQEQEQKGQEDVSPVSVKRYGLGKEGRKMG
jgi:hypothetical protein